MVTRDSESIKGAGERRVVPSSFGALRRLGSVTRLVSEGFRGVGGFIGATLGIAGRSSTAAEPPTTRDQTPSARETDESSAIEEFLRWRGAEDRPTLSELEERLRLMTDAVAVLQERIRELSTRGPISKADMWEEIGSLEAAASLSNDERAVLASILRHNVALQKPQLLSAAAVEAASQRR